MSRKRAKRQYTVEERGRILEEARQPNTAVAEVLRRHQVDAATFSRWEQQAKEGMREGLEGRNRGAQHLSGRHNWRDSLWLVLMWQAWMAENAV